MKKYYLTIPFLFLLFLSLSPPVQALSVQGNPSLRYIADLGPSTHTLNVIDGENNVNQVIFSKNLQDICIAGPPLVGSGQLIITCDAKVPIEGSLQVAPKNELSTQLIYGVQIPVRLGNQKELPTIVQTEDHTETPAQNQIPMQKEPETSVFGMSLLVFLYYCGLVGAILVSIGLIVRWLTH